MGDDITRAIVCCVQDLSSVVCLSTLWPSPPSALWTFGRQGHCPAARRMGTPALPSPGLAHLCSRVPCRHNPRTKGKGYRATRRSLGSQGGRWAVKTEVRSKWQICGWSEIEIPLPGRARGAICAFHCPSRRQRRRLPIPIINTARAGTLFAGRPA